MKLTFYQGTNMAQAAAEVTAFTNRAQAIFPPGSQPPFILRFDASTLPIGQLVLSSKMRSSNELMDLANVYVRSSFTSIPACTYSLSAKHLVAECCTVTCIAGKFLCSHLHCAGVSATLLSEGFLPSLINPIFSINRFFCGGKLRDLRLKK